MNTFRNILSVFRAHHFFCGLSVCLGKLFWQSNAVFYLSQFMVQVYECSMQHEFTESSKTTTQVQITYSERNIEDHHNALDQDFDNLWLTIFKLQ